MTSAPKNYFKYSWCYNVIWAHEFVKIIWVDVIYVPQTVLQLKVWQFHFYRFRQRQIILFILNLGGMHWHHHYEQPRKILFEICSHTELSLLHIWWERDPERLLEYLGLSFLTLSTVQSMAPPQSGIQVKVGRSGGIAWDGGTRWKGLGGAWGGFWGF